MGMDLASIIELKTGSGCLWWWYRAVRARRGRGEGFAGETSRMGLGVVLIVQSGLFFAVDQGNRGGGVPLFVLILGAIVVSVREPLKSGYEWGIMFSSF